MGDEDRVLVRDRVVVVVSLLSDADAGGRPALSWRRFVAADGWVRPAGPTPNRFSTFSVMSMTACFGQIAVFLVVLGVAGKVVLDVDEVVVVAVGAGHSSLNLLTHQLVPLAQTPAPLGAE